MLNEPVVAKLQGIVEATVLIVVQDVPPHREVSLTALHAVSAWRLST